MGRVKVGGYSCVGEETMEILGLQWKELSQTMEEAM